VHRSGSTEAACRREWGEFLKKHNRRQKELAKTQGRRRLPQFRAWLTGIKALRGLKFNMELMS
jgi:hypothetical protein